MPSGRWVGCLFRLAAIFILRGAPRRGMKSFPENEILVATNPAPLAGSVGFSDQNAHGQCRKRIVGGYQGLFIDGGEVENFMDNFNENQDYPPPLFVLVLLNSPNLDTEP